MIPLLMTASISTRGMKGACFSDEEREGMYVGALKYYLSTLMKDNPDQKIVFVDNSGWDLKRVQFKLKSFNLSGTEFISLPPTDFDISKGKGYNELLLLMGGVKSSSIINKYGTFMKVTGRYPIYNIGHLISDASIAIEDNGIELYCDIKDHKIYDWLHLGWNGHSFDCRIFATTKEFFIEKMSSLYVECDDYAPEGGKLLEDVLFRFIKNLPGKYSLRFKREPIFGGIEGSNISALSFSKNQNSLKGQLKRAIGNGIRIFLPRLKF